MGSGQTARSRRMKKATASLSRIWHLPALCGLALLAGLAAVGDGAEPSPSPDPAATYTTHVRPLLTQYCLACHSSVKKRGDLDLERFASLDLARKDVRPWQNVLEMLENGEMPPKKNPQPTAD